MTNKDGRHAQLTYDVIVTRYTRGELLIVTWTVEKHVLTEYASMNRLGDHFEPWLWTIKKIDHAF